MSIIDIRGSHGSGKSWIVHQILGDQRENIMENGKQIGTVALKYDCAVVGWYRSTCGGCDLIKHPDDVVRRVKLFATQHRHVMLEGILVAHTFKRYSNLATEMGDYHFMFLNTPLATCIQRVEARRLARGKTEPFNPRNVVNDWHNIWESVREKCLDAGHLVTILDWKNPLPPVLEILGCRGRK